MNSNNSNIQMNPEQAAADLRMNMDAQNTSIHLSNQYYDNPGQISVNSSIVQDNFVINQLVRPIKFIYQPPNDIDIYHIKCEEIPIQLLNEISSNVVSNINFNQNEYFFFYQQQMIIEFIKWFVK
ncbi:hypothetical protein RhiirA5_441263 [Rhizophagus irregularis]|uniref:Uncharacterized protein n=1 Tax=Rhizophagus irregularis TaxID=588596 RepID=A0A2I1EAE9_9GLOM|nr:hypothetical protein RhiirA5_441263 [Rhizophagus irregularis]PKC62018.1 hypothetical protein RhiirA1_465713 [Rhizophagus irregularis]PKY19110.1 hypothetical protein RhiirB3_432090 [Rhizophagus irregularis]CAB4487361.1 unnamed protein product [Rhizophagus irregularis]CAB5364238.1 unnamed protein product [Rhizophagus irregularis]